MSVLIDEPHVRDWNRMARNRKLPRALARDDAKSFRSPGKRANPHTQHEAEKKGKAAGHGVASIGDRNETRNRTIRINAPATARLAPIDPARS